MTPLTKINNQIFVSALPKTRDLPCLKEMGIKHVINLMMEPHNNNFVESFGINVLHIPVKNYSSPSISQIEQAISFIEEHHTEKILIHCWAGLGRTGTIVGCYLVKHEDMSPDKAIKHVRNLRPGSIETGAQEKIIHDYYNTIKPKSSFFRKK